MKAMQRRCPVCGAPAGINCDDDGRPRKRVHAEREQPEPPRKKYRLPRAQRKKQNRRVRVVSGGLPSLGKRR